MFLFGLHGNGFLCGSFDALTAGKYMCFLWQILKTTREGIKIGTNARVELCNEFHENLILFFFHFYMTSYVKWWQKTILLVLFSRLKKIVYVEF